MAASVVILRGGVTVSAGLGPWSSGEDAVVGGVGGGGPEGVDELWELAVALDPAELLGGGEHAGGGPAQVHGAVLLTADGSEARSGPPAGYRLSRLAACGFSPDRPALFTSLGVSQYIFPEAFSAKMEQIGRLPGMGTLVASFIAPEVMTDPANGDAPGHRRDGGRRRLPM